LNNTGLESFRCEAAPGILLTCLAGELDRNLRVAVAEEVSEGDLPYRTLRNVYVALSAGV
jgi:hypothetical protein